MGKTIKEKFKGSYKIIFVTIVLSGIGLFFGVKEQGFQENIINATLLLLLFIVFMTIVVFCTYVTITSDKKLICKRPLEWGFKIDIDSITKIDRTSVFIIKKWGSRLRIHYENEYNNDNWQTIREANYSVNNIKTILKRLKEINPSIKLHPQYQDLVDGKIEASNSFKSDEIEGVIE